MTGKRKLIGYICAIVLFAVVMGISINLLPAMALDSCSAVVGKCTIVFIATATATCVIACLLFRKLSIELSGIEVQWRYFGYSIVLFGLFFALMGTVRLGALLDIQGILIIAVPAAKLFELLANWVSGRLRSR